MKNKVLLVLAVILGFSIIGSLLYLALTIAGVVLKIALWIALAAVIYYIFVTAKKNMK